MAVELSWPILGVVIPCVLIATGGYGTYFYILKPHHDSVTQLVVFQVCLSMTWLSYALAIIKPAGSPPRSGSFQFNEREWKRWCIKCAGWKPERSHHCRQCGTCVLKMDHHCPWTYNCVGNDNMPHFVRFLVWVDVTCVLALKHLGTRAVALYQSRKLPAYLISKSEVWATVGLTPVVAFVLLTVGILTGRVFVNIFNGQTQIETWEAERVHSLVRRGLVRHVDFPYDIDPWTNLVHACGPVYTWLWPWGPPGTDGLHFEKNEAVDDGSVWPPDHRDHHPPLAQHALSSTPVTLGYATASRPYTPHYRVSSSSSSSSMSMSNVPEWRRGITRDDDFYRSDQWHNFEGEKISDFGVDIDTVATPVPRESEHDDDENVPLARLVR